VVVVVVGEKVTSYLLLNSDFNSNSQSSALTCRTQAEMSW